MAQLSRVLAGISMAIFLSTLVFQAHSLTLIPLADKAGLPYPDATQAVVFLKQALVTLDVTSTWGAVQGYNPWHSVSINHTASYVFQNSGRQTTIPLRIPMLTIPTQQGNGLLLRVDGQAVNYTSVEYVTGPEEGSGVTLEIYTLSITLPVGGQTSLDARVLQFGAARQVEAQYTYYMMNASRWAKPLENFDLILRVNGGAFTNSTMSPTTTGQSEETWSFSNFAPSEDLAVSWKITLPQPPFQPFPNVGVDAVVTIVTLSLATVSICAIVILVNRTPKAPVPEDQPHDQENHWT